MPSTEGHNATKLLIVYEKIPVKVNIPKKLFVKAVDKGRLDTNRDDLIEFNLTSLSYPKPVAKLSQYTLNLVNGTTTLTLIGPLKEMLLITVNWKSGETKLESHSILMQVGGARFVNNESFGKNFLINEDTWILWLKPIDISLVILGNFS